MKVFTGGEITEYVQDKNVFYIRPYNPFKSIKLLGDLQKLIAPALGGLADLFAPNSTDEGNKPSDLNSILDKKIDSKVFQAMIMQISGVVNGNELEIMVRRILDKDYVSVSIDGNDPVKLDENIVNAVFTDDVMAIFPLVFEVLKVNYKGFSRLSRIRFGENVG